MARTVEVPEYEIHEKVRLNPVTTALVEHVGERHRVAARVRGGHELFGARAQGSGDGDLVHHPTAHGEAAPALLRAGAMTSSRPCPETSATRAGRDGYPSCAASSTLLW